MKKDKSKTEAKGVGDLPKTVLFGLLIISAINMAPFLEILTGFNLISFASEKYPKHPYIFCMAVFILGWVAVLIIIAILQTIFSMFDVIVKLLNLPAKLHFGLRVAATLELIAEIIHASYLDEMIAKSGLDKTRQIMQIITGLIMLFCCFVVSPILEKTSKN